MNKTDKLTPNEAVRRAIENRETITFEGEDEYGVPDDPSRIEALSERRESHESHESHGCQKKYLEVTFAALAGDEREEFEERAALIEHDAGKTRTFAEYLAFRNVLSARK